MDTMTIGDNTADDPAGESRTGADDRANVQSVVAENERLRERVAELEDAIADIQSQLSGDETSVTADRDTDGTPVGGESSGGSTTSTNETEPTSHGSQPTKVVGKLGDDDGVGVLGETTGSGDTKGVVGVTQADGDTANDVYPRGVLGEATGSSRRFGVHGKAQGPGGTGVVGEAAEGTIIDYNDTFPIGVSGGTDYDDSQTGVNGAAGVYGITNASGSGSTYAVFAHDLSSADDSWGIYCVGDSYVDGNQEVTGSQSVGNLGVDAYMSSDLTVDDSDTTVVFDTVREDDANEYDSSTGEFSPERAGDFLITAQVEWGGNAATEGDAFFLKLEKNGGELDFVSNTYSGSFGDTQQLTYVVRGLQTSDTITIEANSNTNNGSTIAGGESYTWFQASKIA